MDWHRRYLQQASWTRELRGYLLNQAGIADAQRVLEVGCGTGAVLMDLVQHTAKCPPGNLSLHGLDIKAEALQNTKRHAPEAVLTRGDAHRLPFADRRFDITFCHFVLMWLAHPSNAVGEMRRVTRAGGHVLALAEPDYTGRVDFPAELAHVGELQRQALIARGADPSIGARIANLFDLAGLKIVETGTIKPRAQGEHDDAEWEAEWDVIRDDLSRRLPDEELDRLEDVDRKALRSGQHRMHVPTFFVHARV